MPKPPLRHFPGLKSRERAVPSLRTAAPSLLMVNPEVPAAEPGAGAGAGLGGHRHA